MILRAFRLALGQLGDGRFLRVMLIGVALSLALLLGVSGGVVALIGWVTPETLTLPLVGKVVWVDDLFGWGSLLLAIGLSVFLMVPVAALFTGLLLEDVARAVEDRHYSGLPPVPRQPFADTALAAVSFFGLLIGLNLLALFLYVLVGPFAPLMFWALNGYLLGREYFDLAATRRIGRRAAKALRRQNSGRIWLAGILMAAPLSVPFANLLVPALGAATFTHLFHAMAAGAGRGPV